MKTGHYGSQRGATFFGVLSVLIVAGIFLTVGFKLYPAYWDHATINSVVKATAEDNEELARTPVQIRQNINRKFLINQVSLPSQDALKITDQSGMVKFELIYEIRVPMFYNVDAVVKFEEIYEVRKP